MKNLNISSRIVSQLTPLFALGVLCNLNGSWISDAAGMRFDICYKNSTRKKFRIHLADRIPPNEDGFLCDGNWTVFGELPFLHSGMVIALAVHEKDKHIATFIGNRVIFF